ncbi:MAG: hypothetical protein KAV87_09760 [Desulfobacteraceae bacterium]|nr:hypothetical protein [Desulfobacteraceae bacterium]
MKLKNKDAIITGAVWGIEAACGDSHFFVQQYERLYQRTAHRPRRRHVFPLEGPMSRSLC